MMFDKYCINKILAGEKNVTRRIPKGRRPAVPGQREGFSTRKEYIDYFMDINNIDILNDYDLVWRVKFTLL